MNLPLSLIGIIVCSWIFGRSSICHARHDVRGTQKPPTTSSKKLLPAAQVEIYTTYGGTRGLVDVSILPIDTLVPEGCAIATKILWHAIRKWQWSVTHNLPDYASDYPIPPSLPNATTHVNNMQIQVLTCNVHLKQGMDESYRIEGDATGNIFLVANTVFGALHGLESMAQLLDFGWLSERSNNAPIYIISDLPFFIADAPVYTYRGLMIDTSRHYLPLSLILQNLNAMAANKLNVLHWHLTDSQSWPWEYPSDPTVAHKGAYHPRRIYTSADIRTVIMEAYLQGIRVIPEVDMPGHIQSLAQSHPEWLSDCPHPSEPLDPTKPAVYQDFIKTVYRDLTTNLFVDDFVHVGGDEVDMSCWNQSSSIRHWMQQHNMSRLVDLYEYFEQKLLDIVVNDMGKTPIVWQEVFNLNLTIPRSALVDVWKGLDQATLNQTRKQSQPALLSGCWYLDHLGDSWETFYYHCNPADVYPLQNKDNSFLQGGHASMWGEHVDASNFLSRVWPRASSMAERLWSGNATEGATLSIRQRLHRFRCQRLVQQGIPASPVGPGSCPAEIQSSCSTAQYENEMGKDELDLAWLEDFLWPKKNEKGPSQTSFW